VAEETEDPEAGHGRPELRAPGAVLGLLLLQVGSFFSVLVVIMAGAVVYLSIRYMPVIRETIMAYIIAEPCIGTKDASCVAVCPVDCIYEGDDQYYINPDECIDCGACEPECPVEAIFADDSVPEQWNSFIEKNRAFFGA